MVISWGCSIANDATVVGTVASNGDDFTASMAYGFTTVNIQGTRQGSSVSGTFSIVGGVCNGDSGTFSLGR